MISLFIYIAAVVGALDTASYVACLLASSVAVIAGVFLFVSYTTYGDDKESIHLVTWFKRVITILVIALGVNVITPSQNQMYMIAAAYMAENTYSSFSQSEEFEKVRKIIQIELDKHIQSLSDEKLDNKNK